MLTYNQAIEYLESFINYEKIAAPYDQRKWKLERMDFLLRSVGNPHHGLKFIHVAGTKGKGSTAAMIASVLTEADFKVGLYTSPHLVSFRERIRINGEMISEDRVCDLVTRLKPNIDELKKHEDRLGYISFFDVYTALGLFFFALEKVDFAVLEVGMGGRLDATNVVQPLVSVITQISYDHMISLGDTLEAIAAEKAGIIKDNGYVITSPQTPEALEVIRNTCQEKKARLFEVGKDVCFQKEENHPSPSFIEGGESFLDSPLAEENNLLTPPPKSNPLTPPLKGNLLTPPLKRGIGGFHGSFSVTGIFDRYESLRVPLLGDHQLINAATAVGALEVLRFHGFTVSAEDIRTGLERVKWPARVEVIQRNPVIILDAAHNAASAKALRDAIESNFSYEKLILIIGTLLHKDIKGMGRHLCPIADEIILTKVDSPRAMNPEDMKAELADICEDVIITEDAASALEKARSIAGPRDVICITGAVCFAGEVTQVLERE